MWGKVGVNFNLQKNNMKNLTIYLLVAIGMLYQCMQKKEKQVSIPLGQWRATLFTQGQELPFELISEKTDAGDTIFLIRNGEEEIVLDKFELRGDTLVLPMHIFDTKIVAEISEKELNGIWTKNYEDDYKIKFKAEYGKESRFDEVENPIDYDFSGRWAVTFFNEEVRRPAIGEFEQDGSKIAGTFLTKTGDYRFLEGVITEKGFKLSTFDGEHAYLFEAELTAGDTLRGEYWSGKTGYYKWKAYRNENAELIDADSLTFAKNRAAPFHISYPNEKGNLISLNDERYNDKVVIVQILGSWCANCMDETAFLSKWYRENRDRGVEIVGLAFERKADFEYGASRIKILKERYDIGYEILFAGKNEKETISKALPMITRLVSFPTTLFIDKKGRIEKIHTGFAGPGTGEHYHKFVEEFNETIDKLLME